MLLQTGRNGFLMLKNASLKFFIDTSLRILQSSDQTNLTDCEPNLKYKLVENT